MFDLNEYLQLQPANLTRETVFSSSSLSPIIIEWWHPHPVYRLHTHIDFEEFAIMRQGIGIHYNESYFQLLAPGDAMFIGKDSPHGYLCTYKMGLFNVVFTADHFYSKFPEVEHILNEIKTIKAAQIHFSLSPQNLRETLSIVHRIEYERAHEMDSITFSTMFSLFLQISIILLRDNSKIYADHSNIRRELTQPHENTRLEALITTIKHIRQHADERINEITCSLNDHHLNSKTIQRYFLKYAKISIHKFILLQKIVNTMNLIIHNPEVTITDLIEKSQYVSYRTFARQTDNFFQLSPKEFHAMVLKIEQMKMKHEFDTINDNHLTTTC